MIKTYKPKFVGEYKVRALATFERFKDSNEVTLYALEGYPCRLKDIFPEPETFGIFYALINGQYKTTFAAFFNKIIRELQGTEGVIDFAHAIDMEYIYNYSGEKLVSALMTNMYRRIMENNPFMEEFPPKETFKPIENIICARFLRKWSDLWDTLTVENPLSPLEIDTDEKIENTLTSNRNQHDNTQDDYNASGNQKNRVWGFNTDDSGDGVPHDASDTTDESHDTRDRTATEEYSRQNPITRKTTRTGNIGNITKQQLIEQQREMLQWQFFDQVFADCDTVLTRGMF